MITERVNKTAMFIKKQSDIAIPSSEITPESVYLNRRQFMKGAAALSVTTLIAAACRSRNDTPSGTPSTPAPPEDVLTPEEDVTGYTNFYEFSTDKEAVVMAAQGFRTSPWEVEVGGLVRHPGIYNVDDLQTQFDQEERIYRLRCVEGWSMVIPWLGFPLKKLLEKVEPLTTAKHVRFETLYEPELMSGQQSDWYEWPYVEGLRLDEAMNDLTLLATGLYGKALLPQNGAPLRLVVPWKYGFKSIKSVVKIELVDYQPTSLWMSASSEEYGYYANVNPQVPHPRWSQATERRIGELSRRKTMLFNGYEEQVAYLYEGMDLAVNF